MSESIERRKVPIYVIGFPKSGNTWLARLLASATCSEIEATNAIDNADNSRDLNGVYIIRKRHDSMKTFRPDGERVVYIVRDVRDVLVSAFFFNNKFFKEEHVKIQTHITGVKRGLFRIFFWNQIRRMSKSWCGNELSVILNWLAGRKNVIGNWSDHVESWIAEKNVIVVRYEDLLSDAPGEMKKILSFFRIHVAESELQAAIASQSFKEKKKQFVNAGDSINVKFMRSGQAGQWRDYLSKGMLDSIERRHARVMIKCGYDLRSKKVKVT